MATGVRVGEMSRLTFLFALPRSRTQWFAEMMGRNPHVTAWHDPSKHCASPKQLVDKIDAFMARSGDHLFIADTAALMFHSYLTWALPDMTDIYCYRPFEAVRASVRKQTGHDWAAILSPMHARLQAIRALGGNVFFDFDNIREVDLALCMNLCTGHLDFDAKELRAMCNEIVDTPISEQENYPEKTRSLLGYREIG